MFVDSGFEKGGKPDRPSRCLACSSAGKDVGLLLQLLLQFSSCFCLSPACVFGYRGLYRIERNDLVLIDAECVSHLNVDTLSHDQNMFAKGSRGIRISGVIRVAARVEVAAFLVRLYSSRRILSSICQPILNLVHIPSKVEFAASTLGLDQTAEVTTKYCLFSDGYRTEY